MNMEKCPSGYKLEPRFIEAYLIGYADSSKRLAFFWPLKYNVDTVRYVKLEPASYTSVDVRTLPLPCDLADNLATIIQELRPETPLPITETTTASTLQTLTGSNPVTPLQSPHPSPIEVPSPATHIQEHLQAANDTLEPKRDSVATNPIAGALTRLYKTSTRMLSAPK